MSENPEPSTSLSPEEKRWLRQGDKFWSHFREKRPERRDLVWFLFGVILFWFGGHLACPIRFT